MNRLIPLGRRNGKGSFGRGFEILGSHYLNWRIIITIISHSKTVIGQSKLCIPMISNPILVASPIGCKCGSGWRASPEWFGNTFLFPAGQSFEKCCKSFRIMSSSVCSNSSAASTPSFKHNPDPIGMFKRRNYSIWLFDEALKRFLNNKKFIAERFVRSGQSG